MLLWMAFVIFVSQESLFLRPLANSLTTLIKASKFSTLTNCTNIKNTCFCECSLSQSLPK